MHKCDICEELIDLILRPKIKSSSPERGFVNIQAINFGWLDSIIENSLECNLCRLVTDIWERTHYDEHDIPSDGHLPNHDPSKRVYVCLDNSTPTTLTEDGIRLHWMIGIDFFYPGQNGQPSQPVATKWEPKFALLADDFENLKLTKDVSPILLARLRQSHLPFDHEFLKSCFNTCLTEHGQICDNPVREGTNGRSFPLATQEQLPLRMRCIDVIGENIVHIPRDGTCQYAVLSYVWGNSNYLRLIKANYAQLTARNGLKHVRKPRTISDAIEVTRALGLQYLWIDSLCIIQDYDSEKLQQIQKMNVIYSQAILTIVAASATEADGGLWNVSEGSRETQIVEEIAGLRFVGTEPTLETILSVSKWKKRAWTYQEYVLSKRLLIFSGTQAYFSCEKGACAEDYVHSIVEDGKQQLEYPDSDNAIGVSVDRLLNFPTLWFTLVREYTARELSFEADVLNAAAGVMSSFGTGSEDSFVCGLPLRTLFEYGMLWYPSRPLRRRSLLNNGERFPTWSWVGWVGPVTYEESTDPLDFESSKIIHQWSLQSAQKILRYDNGDLRVHHRNGHQHYDECMTTPIFKKSEVDRHLSTMESCTLSFRTRHAQFRVEQSVNNQFTMSDDIHCEFTGLYKVFHEDNWIGSVHLEHHVSQQMISSNRTHFDFIALSTSSTGPCYVPERSNPTELDPESDWVPLFDVALLEQCEDDVYNVMLVMPEESTAIMTRLGIGQIHKESFDAEATLKEIELG